MLRIVNEKGLPPPGRSRGAEMALPHYCTESREHTTRCLTFVFPVVRRAS